MSTYGRLWDQVRSIREQLSKLVPDTRLNRELTSLAAAREAVHLHVRTLNELLQRWDALEQEMAKHED